MQSYDKLLAAAGDVQATKINYYHTGWTADKSTILVSSDTDHDTTTKIIHCPNCIYILCGW